MAKIKVALIGAGGKMGTRTSNNLMKYPDEIELYACEQGERGIQSLKDRGLKACDPADVVPGADVVVLAVPDSLIYKVSGPIVELMDPGAAMVILDPAAAVAKELALRDDCTFAVCHPCHPSYFLDQDTPEARKDWFGGLGGKQDLVMAKIQGDDGRFAQCQQVARLMFDPVVHVYVMGMREIAFLEPTLVELLGATCLHAMAETVDEAERRGIDRAAAISFMTGHVLNLTANFLGLLGKTPVSDACQVAMGLGDKMVLREDWRRIWDDEVLDRVIATMLHPENPKI